MKEMSQQHKRECFVPRHKNSLSDEELKKAQEAIKFLTKKKMGKLKAEPFITESLLENG